MIAKLFRNTLIASAVTLPIIPLGTGKASASSLLDFTLHNRDEMEITQLYVSVKGSHYWGSNILRQDIPGGSSMPITYSGSARYCVYDILAVWADGSKGRTTTNLCNTSDVSFD